MPLSVITGLFGANLSVLDGNILNARSPAPFLLLSASLLLVALLSFAIIRRTLR